MDEVFWTLATAAAAADDVLSETGAEVCKVVAVLMGGTPPSADSDGLGECPMSECAGRTALAPDTKGVAEVNMWLVEGVA